jgi:predicted O-methyltransferase YrrM
MTPVDVPTNRRSRADEDHAGAAVSSRELAADVIVVDSLPVPPDTTSMDATRRRVVEEVYARGQAHDLEHDDRSARYRNLEPETGELLNVLVRVCRARRILELGTSTGHSTLWLADAAEATDGVVESIEIDPERTAIALDHVRRAGLTKSTRMRVADIGEVLSASDAGAWDFMFLDAERPHYVDYLPDLLRALTVHGVLAVDNMISHADELVPFRAAVEAEGALTQTVVQVGAGLLVAVKEGMADTGKV